MVTYQMVGVADQNGRTYKCEYGKYNKNDGFIFNNRGLVTDVETLMWIFFHEDMWKLDEPERKKMSIADIEKELGYRVQITDPEYNKPTEEKKDLTKKQKDEIDSLVDLFHRMFDIEIDPKKYY